MVELWEFSVITGGTVERILREDAAAVVDTVRRAYLAYEAGEAASAHSQFLRFDDLPDARIISLPASLRYEFPVSGMKWISSYPGNVQSGIPRASAVLVLNRRDTGHPFALLEASIISASRTAAAAVLAAEHIGRLRSKSCTFGIVGCGLIARHTLEMFVRLGWSFDNVLLHDTMASSAAQFAEHVARLTSAQARVTSLQSLLAESPLVLFATTAGVPYVHDPAMFRSDATVLHMSLRDLSPEVILSGANIVDDVDHCLRAATSLHLTEQAVRHRRFIHGTLAQLSRGEIDLPAGRPVFFSPFGMGMLDIAVGRHVYLEATRRGLAQRIDDFFHEKTR